MRKWSKTEIQGASYLHQRNNLLVQRVTTMQCIQKAAPCNNGTVGTIGTIYIYHIGIYVYLLLCCCCVLTYGRAAAAEQQHSRERCNKYPSEIKFLAFI